MASQSQVDLCNISLLSIGARAQVSSVNPSDGSTAADACSKLFTYVFESLARAAHWNCLRAQTTLTLLAAARGTPENPLGTLSPQPPSPWLYSYALPSNSLAIRYLQPSFPATSQAGIPLTSVQNNSGTYLANGGQVPYAVAYSTDVTGNPIGVILTNLSQAQAVYTIDQSNPIIWDSLFTSAFVAALGAYLVPALALHTGLMQLSIKTADTAIAQARAADGNESVVSQNREASWIAARQGESGYWSGAGGLFANYSSMPWPSYAGE